MRFFLPVTLGELRKLSDQEIVVRINEKIAPDRSEPNFSIEDFVGAQFYVDELNRRETQRAEKKRDDRETRRWRIDFLLEALIVLLICVEIGRSWSEGSQQLRVLGQLVRSASATAGRLEDLRTLTGQMNQGIQTEPALNYDVIVEVTFDNSVKHVNIANKGRTNVYLWGDKVDGERPNLDVKGRMIATGGYYYILADKFYEDLGQRLPKGSDKLVPFTVYLKNDHNDEFIVECQFFAVWYLDNLTIHTQTTSIRRGQFPERHN